MKPSDMDEPGFEPINVFILTLIVYGSLIFFFGVKTVELYMKEDRDWSGYSAGVAILVVLFSVTVINLNRIRVRLSYGSYLSLISQELLIRVDVLDEENKKRIFGLFLEKYVDDQSFIILLGRISSPCLIELNHFLLEEHEKKRVNFARDKRNNSSDAQALTQELEKIEKMLELTRTEYSRKMHGQPLPSPVKLNHEVKSV